MPTTDFRVQCGFCSHPKTRKLERIAGDGAPMRFLQLIEFCAMTAGRSDGRFDGMDADDVEIAAGWTGDRSALVDALLAVGFLDEDEDGILSIHDFSEHQPWVFHADTRKAKARNAAQARWGNKTKKRPNASSNAKTRKSDASSNAKPAKSDATSTDFACPISNSNTNSNSNSNTNLASNSTLQGGIRSVPLRTDDVVSGSTNNWKPGDPINSVADLEVFVAKQGWAVGGISSRDRGKATALIRAGPITDAEVHEGLNMMGAITPSRPVSYWLGCIGGARDEYKAASERPAAPPKPKPRSLEDRLRELGEL